MLGFLLVFLLIVNVYTDTAPCVGASKFQTTNFKIYWCTSFDQKNIIFTLNASMYNYFAINYKPTMTNTNYTIIEIQNETIMVRNYWTSRHQRPIRLDFDGLIVLGTDTDKSTYIAVKYILPINSIYSLSPEFVTGQIMNFSLAWRNSTSVSNHGPNLQYFSGKLQNGSISEVIQNVSPKISNLILAHGIVLTLCWCLIADLAVFLITYRNRTVTYILHIGLIIIVLIGNLIVVISVLVKRGGISQFQQLHSSSKAHLTIGIIILLWFAIQLITGCLTRFLQIFTVVHPNFIKISSWIHLISGYIMLLLAKVNVLLGWWLSGVRSAFWILLAWNFLVICLFVARKIFQMLGKFSGNRNIPKIMKVNESPSLLMSLIGSKPYNHPSLKNFNYVVFADYVYDTSKFRFLHPGGRYIIDSLRGRQVDRFVYGMYSPETLPNFSAFHHSQQAFKAMGAPQFKLSQPLQNGSLIKMQGIYLKTRHQRYSKDMYIVEFSPFCFEVPSFSRPSLGYEYLGQYFTLTAFNTTRLYTRVQCLMPQNKILQRKALNALGYTFNLLDTQVWQSSPQTPKPQVSNHYAIPNQSERSFTESNRSRYSVAFLMKKYKNGAFTNKLLSSQLGSQMLVNISPPMGRGLDIDNISGGRIVIFAGGSGIFPFMDLLDILFKTVLLEDNRYPPQEILAISPVLSHHNLLKFFTFEFYIALQQTLDIHPVHFSMIQFLASSRPNSITFTIKAKDKRNETSSPGLAYTNERFNTDYLSGLYLNSSKLSMIYICGSPLMNSEILKSLKQLGVGQHLIYII